MTSGLKDNGGILKENFVHDKRSQGQLVHHEQKVRKLIATMPMSMWTGELVEFDNDVFRFKFDVLSEDEEIGLIGRRKPV
jgi:hypothetical protein